MDELEAISVDNDFTAEVKAKAKGIMGELKGKNTLVLFHFLIDIVQELAKWSKQLQKRAGTLIGLEQYRTRMLESLRALKTHHGTYLAGYLSVDLVCSSVTGRRKISLQQYYSSESVKQKNCLTIRTRFHSWILFDLGQTAGVSRKLLSRGRFGRF